MQPELLQGTQKELNGNQDTSYSVSCAAMITFCLFLHNNNNNQFLYSAFHNNRINALYISALVIGPITSLFNVSQLPGEYTTWATVYSLQRLFHSQYQPLPTQVPIYTPG